MKNKIKILRAEHGLSQQELAESLSVSRQTINAIEQGKYAPSLPLALAIGKKFSTPVEQIFQQD
ncbi:MAG: helix-turn-helix transcriptional regulator [Schleiferiaceae bacterium]